MSFKLRIPAREDMSLATLANPANPLTQTEIASNDPSIADATVGPISRLAGLAADAVFDSDHEAKVERSAIISADGVPYWEADDRAGLLAWTDAEIVTFDKRVARITWLGYADAKGLAEKLLYRDRDDDDRRLCVECSHAGPARRCAKREAFLADQLQRCPLFKEKPP